MILYRYGFAIFNYQKMDGKSQRESGASFRGVRGAAAPLTFFSLAFDSRFIMQLSEQFSEETNDLFKLFDIFD